jgi:sulfatase modifying factor 1
MIYKTTTSMKHPISFSFGLIALANIAHIGSASAVVSIDYVTVGNSGNAADPLTRYGSVAYEYKIAKNETTIGQYTEFLNAVAKSDPYALYSTNMGSNPHIAGISRVGDTGSYSYSVIGSSANKPITLVGWYSAARFCNWLHNGQGSGSTETGAYTLNGAMSGAYMYQYKVNPGALVWIPSENEWYKAAYYDATKGGTGGYWLYPTQSDTLGGNTIGVPNSANYFDGDYVATGSYDWPTSNALTDVGAYGENSASYYGTNDQGGNVWELNDAVVTGVFRGIRGGSWADFGGGTGAGYLTSSYRYDTGNGGPYLTDGSVGFRVASIPEPGCLVLTVLASGVLVTRRKR